MPRLDRLGLDERTLEALASLPVPITLGDRMQPDWLDSIFPGFFLPSHLLSSLTALGRVPTFVGTRLLGVDVGWY